MFRAVPESRSIGENMFYVGKRAVLLSGNIALVRV
jgi:hypothetical protein